MDTTSRQQPTQSGVFLNLWKQYSWHLPFKNKGEQQLNGEQQRKAATFLSVAETHAGEIELLFRGEGLKRLAKRLCHNTAASLGSIASGLFYFGEKGKHFWKDYVRSEEKSNEKKWKPVLCSINDLTAESFEGLLRHLAKILKLLELDAVQQFRTANPDFCEWIKLEPRRIESANRLGGLPPHEMVAVRNLLIFIVHGFSRWEYKTYTPLVSTTPDFKRAAHFARAERDDNPCVICLFLRTGRMDRVFRSANLAEASTKLAQLGIPSINRSFFIENEVAFFGAVFPHQIYGLVDLNSKTMIWNPTVFDAELDAEAEVWRNGFPIDQSEFIDLMKKRTGYAKGMLLDFDGDNEIEIETS